MEKTLTYIFVCKGNFDLRIFHPWVHHCLASFISFSLSSLPFLFIFLFFYQKHERLNKCECLGTWGMERW